MVYLDLAELPSVVGDRGLIGNRRLSGRSFLKSDHLFDKSASMQSEVRQLIERRTGVRPRGPIRLLTQLRYFGFYFSPLNLFYVFDDDDQQVEFVLAEVSNTPWNERHCYTLWQGNRIGDGTALRFEHAKEFHVSPFMEMDQEYRWHLSQPSRGLSIQLSNLCDQDVVFSAGMTMKRRDMSRQQLNRMMLRYPVVTAQIVAAIYYQALRLWWKKCPFYAHPKKLRNSPRPPYSDALPDVGKELIRTPTQSTR